MLNKLPDKTLHLKKIGVSFIILIIVGTASYVGYQMFSICAAIQSVEQSSIFLHDTIRTTAAIKKVIKDRSVYINLPGAKPIRAIVEDYSQTDSIWALVSKTHSISTDYVPAPIKIPSVDTRTDKSDEERSVRSDVEQPLINLFTAASAVGYKLIIASGYRSANLQSIYFNSLANSIGDTAANQSIAKPGQSEHQTGLAIDITTASFECYLENCFGETGDGMWLSNNAYKFGFILRYPEDKVAITGYQYEPWHFRYVGVDFATALHESGLTLDEAWSYLEQADATLHKNGAI